MKIIKESNSEETFNRSDVINYTVDTVVKNESKYLNINIGYDSDVSTDESQSRIREVIADIVDNNILPELDGDYEFEDQVYDILENDKTVKDLLDDLNDEMSIYAEEQLRLWKSDRDSDDI